MLHYVYTYVYMTVIITYRLYSAMTSALFRSDIETAKLMV